MIVNMSNSHSPLTFASSLAIDVETMKRVPEADSIAAEARVVFDRIENQLAREGLTLRDVAKATCYLREESYRAEFLDAYKAAFEPGPYPARNKIVLGLAGDCRVQIEVIAETRTTA
jgi:2-iminobutanoate/2-iminopropanoate deaminase